MRKPFTLLRPAALLACILLLPAAGRLHIELETSTPSAGAVLTDVPPSLRLQFSGFIEPAYTSVSLNAPDGQRVVTGRVVFTEDSDREFTVTLPPLTLSGTYTVEWRTAGADGHVLTGSYSFTLDLAGDVAATSIAADSSSAVTAGDPADDPGRAGAGTGGAPDAGADHDHGDGATSDSLLQVIARLLHFTALIALLGALSFRVLLLPRLEAEPAAHARMQRGAWRMLALAAVVLGAAVVLRLWLQSTALHGADRAWSTPLLSMMLTDTSWGRAWVLQAFLFVVLGAGIAWASPPHDRLALAVVLPAAIGLAAMPALSGHAAGASGSAYLAVINDALHVVAAGVWIGMLLLLATVALPALLRSDHSPAERAAAAVRAFSPIALAAAAAVIATGVINSLFHINAPGDLLTTTYGRTLLAKIAIVSVVLLTGFINWRFLTPRLATAGGMQALRRLAAAELVVAVMVLIATAILTGLPRP